MKFLLVLVVIALASVASARNRRNVDLVLGGASSYTNVLAQQIAPLLLQRQPLLNYRPIAAANVANIVAAAPQIFTIAAPVQTAYVQQQSYGPIQAAVQSRRNVQFIDVPSSRAVAPTQSIVIGPSVQPLDLEFQSQSSPVSVRQVHIPGQPNPPQFSSHTDQPDLLKQEIVKPIIHEVTEAIQPFRKITQEVRPVQETINQVITRGQQVQQVQAVQAVPVAVTAAAAPIAVETAAVEAAPISVANINLVAAEPVVETAAPIAVQAIGGELSGFTAFNGQLQTLPVNARITRF